MVHSDFDGRSEHRMPPPEVSIFSINFTITAGNFADFNDFAFSRMGNRMLVERNSAKG